MQPIAVQAVMIEDRGAPGSAPMQYAAVQTYEADSSVDKKI
jgi:hypothetical protein